MGVYEILSFTADQKWTKLINSVSVDSGQYSIGHGNYLPYPGAKNDIYDSVRLFKIIIKSHLLGLLRYTWGYFTILSWIRR